MGIMKTKVSVLVYQRLNGAAEFDGGRDKVEVPEASVGEVEISGTVDVDERRPLYTMPPKEKSNPDLCYQTSADQIAAREKKAVLRRKARESLRMDAAKRHRSDSLV